MGAVGGIRGLRIGAVVLGTVFMVVFSGPVNAEDIAATHCVVADQGGTGKGGNSGSSSDDLIFSGAATKNVPIAVPPGRLGMAPQINLSYNSQQSGLYLGVGWSLDLGSIQREAKEGIDYGGTTFVFSRNGSSAALTLFNAATGEYRQKIDDGSFYRFIYSGNEDPSPSWTVYDKGGNVYYYGQTAGSRQDNPSDASEIFSWNLERVEDSNGNYMKVEYFKETGQIYLDVIYYNYVGDNPSNEVQFYWSTRSDNPFNYRLGFEVKTSKILGAISTVIQGQTASAYDFSYTHSPDSDRSLLAGIQQYGSDADVTSSYGKYNVSGSSLPELFFTYHSSGSGFSTAVDGPSVFISNYQLYNGRYNPIWRDLGRIKVGDFNGDGIKDFYRVEGTSYGDVPDIVYLMNPDGTFSTIQGPPTNICYGHPSVCSSELQRRNVERVQMADFNGDGMTDIYYVRGWDTTEFDSIYLSNGDGTYNTLDGLETWVGSSADAVLRKTARFKFADFNGDGKSDIYFIAGSDSTEIDPIYLSNGDGTFHTVDGLETEVDNSTDGVIGTSSRIKFADFNGDGKTDIYYVTGWGSTEIDPIYLSNGDGTYDTIDGLETWVGSSTAAVIRKTSRIKFADFNGDSKADIYFVAGSDSTEIDPIYLSNGDGTYDTIDGLETWVGSSTAAVLRKTSRIKFGDFNGDGKTDIYYVDGSESSAPDILYLSNGEGFFESNVGPSTYVDSDGDYGYIDISRIGVADLDGDGLDDVFRINGLGDTLPISIFYKNGPYPDLLKAVDNGRGSSISLSYLPSTVYENTFLPYPVQVVASKTVSDAFSFPMVSSYFYSGGYFDIGEKEFRGFRYVEGTNPDGTTNGRWFHQSAGTNDDDDFKGKPEKAEFRSSSGTLLSETYNTWTRGATPQGQYPVFIRLDSTDTTTYVGGVAVTTSQVNTYDSGNGFLTATVTTGPDAESVTTAYAYANSFGNADMWRLRRETASGSSSGTVRETVFDYYTNGTGNLMSKSFLDGDDIVSSISYTYTLEGNIETQTDGNGNTTTTQYGASGTFPVQVCLPTTTTNGVTHCTSAEYDARYGAPRYTWDENSNRTENVFDEFGRVVETISWVGNGPEVAGRSFTEYHDGEYEASGYPNYVVSRVLESTEGGNSFIEGYKYFDGLGRSIQAVTFGENYQPVVSKTYYDEMGRAYSSEGPFFGTGSSGWLYAFPNGEAPYSSTDYNDFGMPETVQTPAGTMQFAYSGLSTTVTDPDGNQRTEEKDYLGRVLRVTEREGSTQYTTHYEYNAAGDLLSVTDANGNPPTEMTYDDLGRKVSMTSPDMGTWNYSYDANGNLTSQTDAKGQVITFTYDELNRVDIKAYSTGQDPVYYTYDNLSISNGRGRLFEVNNFDVLSQVTGYDALGNVLGTAKTITGDSTTYITATEYDLAGRISKMTYPDGYGVYYAYYPGTSLLNAVMEAAPATTWEWVTAWDAEVVSGDSTWEDDVWSGFPSSYDDRNFRINVLNQDTTAGGEKIRLTYRGHSSQDADILGASIGVKSTGSDPWDYAGTPTRVTFNGGNNSGTVPGGGTLVSDEIDYCFNSAVDYLTAVYTTDEYFSRLELAEAGYYRRYRNGDESMIVEPPSIWSFGYNSEDYILWLSKVEVYRRASVGSGDPGVLASFADYDAIGRARTIQYANGSSTAYSYDPSTTWLASILSTAPGGTAVDRAYEYTDAGLIERVLDYRMGDVFGLGGQAVAFAYSYDSLGRLTEEEPSYGFNPSTWTYDAIGNIDYRAEDGQLWEYSYDPVKAHAVTGVTINSNAYSFSYDANGNMLAGVDLTDPANPAARSITWNADNMPVQIVRTGSQTVTTGFLYDGSGVRSRKSDSQGNYTYYVGDHYEITNGTVTKHIFAGSLRIVSISGGSMRYYHKDHLGSTSAVTDGSGNIVETADYKPFGGLRDYSGSVTTQYKFTDQEFDPESGLYNYNARLYDPVLGRFISPDSVVQGPFSPQTLNRYSYVGNNPILIVDDSGHFALIPAMLLGGMISGITTDMAGGDFWQGFTQGAISGAIFFGAGEIIEAGCGAAVQGVEITAKQAAELGIGYSKLAQAGIHMGAGALSGGIGAAMSGGDIGMGMAMGGFSAGFAKYTGGFIKGDAYVDQVVSRIAVGGLTGGVTAELFGGDFGTGFKSGVTTASIGYVCNEMMPHGYVSFRRFLGMQIPSHYRGDKLDQELVAYRRGAEHGLKVAAEVGIDVAYYGGPVVVGGVTLYFTESPFLASKAAWTTQTAIGAVTGKPIYDPIFGIFEIGNVSPSY